MSSGRRDRFRAGSPRARWQRRWEARMAERWGAPVEGHGGAAERREAAAQRQREWWAENDWPARRVAPVWKVPVLILILAMAGTIPFLDDLGGHHLDGPGWALLVAAPLALGFRRRAPVAVAVVVSVAMSAYYLRGYPAGPLFIAQLVALHALVLAIPTWAAWTFTGVGYSAFAIAEYTVGAQPHLAPSKLIIAAAGSALVMLGTEAGRSARERGAEVRRRRAEAEQRRKEAELRRVSDERLRIAREVHDMLGHHLSLISVQSGVALHLMDSGPPRDPAAEREQLRASLAAIKQASKDALVELRSTVNTLRGVDEDAPRQPAPTVDRLDDLLAGAAAAGVKATIETIGERVDLPPRVDLAAFRIIQEALTNVRRHAGPVPATVTLTYDEHRLVVRIDDDGGTPAETENAPPGGGNGIPGMRERAQSVGGVLRAGPRPEGGFRVRAELPTSGTTNAAAQVGLPTGELGLDDE